jgi:two-component system NtrC family sensor kinase
MSWQLEGPSQSMASFLEERLAALRFISSVCPYEKLSDQQALNEIFTKFKREFSGIVDLGVIDANGIQRSYAGPYRLAGKDYSNQDWFHEVIIRSSYVSDVFMGYRKIPHFSVAVKKEEPEKGTFWILRVTINMETLQRFVFMIDLRGGDDAFIVNKEGSLQTPSRFHGKLLENFSLPFDLRQEGPVLIETKQGDRPITLAYTPIKNTPWFLVAIIKSTPYTKIPQFFRNELFFIGIISILIGIAFTIAMANSVVNRIKKADQEREEAISKIEHASKLASIGRLAAGVAHEINNPLAIINEKAGLMKDILEASEDLERNKEKFLWLIKAIFDSVDRCRTITHRLLGFSRRMDVSYDIINLNDTVKEVIEFLEKEILFRNIRLVLNLQEDLPRIESDKGQLQQVFLNIINNAIDIVDEGGLIEVSTKLKDKETVKVIIRDTGHGIPKDKLKHIFEPFYTTKERGKGTGLGLSISYGIIQKLGGTILVESEVNKGSTFTIELPSKRIIYPESCVKMS